jgi:glucosylceramidase
MVSIDREKKSFRYNDEFYLMKHLSRFVQPGSHLLKLEGEGKNALAFQTAEKEVALVIYNPEASQQEKVIKVDDRTINVSLKPRSLNTLVLR